MEVLVMVCGTFFIAKKYGASTGWAIIIAIAVGFITMCLCNLSGEEAGDAADEGV